MTGRAGTLYLPGDFDGRERGPVPARLALASSLNLAALDVVSRVGPDHFVDRLVELGFTHAATADRDSAAMVLGGIDVTALELAGAYVTLARGGTRVPLALFRGEALEGERVMAPAAARLVTDVLSDAEARRAGFGRDLESLGGGDPFALKTGTSTGFHDAWCAVYDHDFTVLVWVGDPSGEPMESVTGFEAAAPLAVQALASARAHRAELVRGERATEIALATVTVCAQTGLLPGPHCHHVVRERFDPVALPHATCRAHDDDGTLALAPRYAEWARRARPSGVAIAHAEGYRAPPRVSYPREGATLLAPSATAPEITLRAAAGEAVADDARFEVDGAMLHDARYRLAPGHHVVVAMLDGHRSAPVGFEVIAR
jgi:penicillin-binding protein 1C